MNDDEYAKLTHLAMGAGFENLEDCFEDQIEKTKLALKVKNGVSGYEMLSPEERKNFDKQFELEEGTLVDLRDEKGHIGD